MLFRSETSRLAEKRVPEIVKAARKEMSTQLKAEITRLRELKKVNPSVRLQEIDLLVTQLQDLDEHLASARLRLDAVKVLSP